MTPSGPRTVLLNNLGGWPPFRESCQQELGFSWSWSFFETDLFLLDVGSLPHTGGNKTSAV
jgi:hypothetical protein